MAFGNKTKSEKAAPPVHKLRIGLQTASFWENKTDKGTFYTVTFDRRFQDSKSDWHSTNGYGLRDLLILSKLADLAHTKLIEEVSTESDANESETEGESA
jgi:hypothetical protein